MLDKLIIKASKQFKFIPRVNICLEEVVDISTSAVDTPPLKINHIRKEHGTVIPLDECEGYGNNLGANCRIIQRVLNEHFNITTLYLVDISTVRETIEARKDREVVLRTGTGYLVASFLFNKGWVVHE